MCFLTVVKEGNSVCHNIPFFHVPYLLACIISSTSLILPMACLHQATNIPVLCFLSYFVYMHFVFIFCCITAVACIFLSLYFV